MLLYRYMVKAKQQKIEILQAGNPVLRKISVPLTINEIKSIKTKKLILELKKSIDSQSDAAAISAVQIGTPVRLFIISRKVFDTDLTDHSTDKKKISKDLIFINPKIVRVSKMKQTLEEGCLSVRYVYGKVLRPEKVTIEAYDENCKKVSRGFSGLLSQIVQHENDHLNGILFIDKATELQKISPEEYEKMLKTL